MRIIFLALLLAGCNHNSSDRGENGRLFVDGCTRQRGHIEKVEGSFWCLNADGMVLDKYEGDKKP